MTDLFNIPTEFYVGKQQRDDLTLAFLTPNGTDKAALGRIATVDKWVNNLYSGAVALPSEIVKNELLDGYSIEKCVFRNYWGGGNVVWTIQDPRGFAFEISSGNMAKLLECTTVTNGAIKEKCIIGRSGNQNALLPEGSEPYIESVKFTKMAATPPTIFVKDLLPGNVVKLKNTSVVTYLGKYFYIIYDTVYQNRRRIVSFDLSAKKANFYDMHVDEEHNTHYYYSKVTDEAIDSIIDTCTMSKDKIVKGINKERYISSSGRKYIIQVAPNVTKFKEVVMTTRLTTETLIKESHSRLAKLIKIKNRWYKISINTCYINSVFTEEVSFENNNIVIGSFAMPFDQSVYLDKCHQGEISYDTYLSIKDKYEHYDLIIEFEGGEMVVTDRM